MGTTIHAYAYDLLDRATRRVDGGTVTNTFGYNPRSEVVSATLSGTVAAYAYDPVGNRLAATNNAVATAYRSNPLNQYTNILRASAPPRETLPVYDPDGNMVSNGVWSYAWDAENRLVAAFSNATLVVSNAYDHAHRRVLKVTPSATHVYLYDGWNLVQETVATASGTTTKHYVWGKDLSGSFQGAGGVGGLLAVCLDVAWNFPFYDNNGNVTAYVDESGAVVAEYVYDAFGNTIASSGPMADSFRHRFSTKYCDPETGLYYYGYRFYSPEAGRWLNRDPIEEAGGLNLYGFVGNGPVNKTDFLGMSVSPVVLEEMLAAIGSLLFGGRIHDEAIFLYHGGREEFMAATGRQLHSRGVLPGRMWDRAVSAHAQGTIHGPLLKIDEASQALWGNAVDAVRQSATYKERVQFIQRRLREGTSPKGYINIEFNSPSVLASSIHGAQLHYSCNNCKLLLTIRDEYNFDKKHVWRRLQQEGYIIPYSVIIVMPMEKCGDRR